MNRMFDDNRIEDGDRSYVVEEGAGFVLLSAPHQVEHGREGTIKQAEPDTGRLARCLNERIGCPIIYRCGGSLEDPNYDEASAYRDRIVRFVEEKGIKVVLDLHEMAARHQSMVEIGTGHGRNIDDRDDLLAVVRRAFESHGIEPVTVDTVFPAAGFFRVSSDVARRSPACCFQIEMNVRMFGFDACPSAFEAVCGSLEEAVIRLGEVI